MKTLTVDFLVKKGLPKEEAKKAISLLEDQKKQPLLGLESILLTELLVLYVF